MSALPPTRLFDKMRITNEQKHRNVDIAVDAEYIRRCNNFSKKLWCFGFIDAVLSFFMSGLSLLPFRIILLASGLLRFIRAKRISFDARKQAGHLGVIQMYWYRQKHASVDVHSLPALKKFSLITQNRQTAEYQFLTIVYILTVVVAASASLLIYLCVTESNLILVLLFAVEVALGVLFEYWGLANFYEHMVVGSVERHLSSSKKRRKYAQAASIHRINRAVTARNKIHSEYMRNSSIREVEEENVLDLNYTPEYLLAATEPHHTLSTGFSNLIAVDRGRVGSHQHQL